MGFGRTRCLQSPKLNLPPPCRILNTGSKGDLRWCQKCLG
jgi:hypothetical protein